MKPAWMLVFVCAAWAQSLPQQSSANRYLPVQPAARSGFWEDLLRPLEPDKPTRLTPKARLREYLRQTIGPDAILREAAAASISQAIDSPPEWGGGARGYADRFGADMGTLAVHSMFTYGLSAALREDNRYFAASRPGTLRRIWHATLSPFVTRHDDESTGFSYSNVAGVAAASVISRAWSPPSWQGGEQIGRNIAITFAGEAGFNVFREFLPDILHRR